jgi:hypothetical protein
LKLFAVKQFNCLVRFLIRTHFYEAKAPSFAAELILHNVDCNDRACLRKEVLKLVFKNVK